MRVTFDRSANAAYIYLTTIPPGGAARQHVVDERHARGQIILDLDSKGRLIGVEVLNATAALPVEVLDAAERI